MDVKKCFFCDKVVIPVNLVTTEEISNFFKDNKLAYTLNYVRFKSVIGNKIVCCMCESDIRIITNYQDECDCESCRNEKEIQNITERND